MKIRKDITQVLVMITLGVVPLVFIPIGQGDFFYLPKVFALRLIVMAYLLVIYKYRNKLNNIIPTDWINRLLLIYLGWLIFSTVFSIGVSNSILGKDYRVEGLSTIILYFALFLIARHQGTISKKNIYFMLITGCVIVIYGILQSYGFEIFPRDFIRRKWMSPFSTIGNPNFLGSYIVLLLPFAVNLFVIEKKKFGLWAYTILFFGLLTTMTRGTWIGAFIAIAIYFLLIFTFRSILKFRFKDSIPIVLSTIICFTLFNFTKSGEFLSRLLSITQDIGMVLSGDDNLGNAGSYRMFIWLKTIELIKIRPIVGFGLENLHIAFNQYFSADIIKVIGRPALIDKAHNEYLHIAVSTGIPSLLIYLSFISLIIRRGVSKVLELPYAIPLLVSMIGYLVQAFFNISVVSVAYIFWVFLGFLASSKPIET